MEALKQVIRHHVETIDKKTNKFDQKLANNQRIMPQTIQQYLTGIISYLIVMGSHIAEQETTIGAELRQLGERAQSLIETQKLSTEEFSKMVQNYEENKKSLTQTLDLIIGKKRSLHKEKKELLRQTQIEYGKILQTISNSISLFLQNQKEYTDNERKQLLQILESFKVSVNEQLTSTVNGVLQPLVKADVLVKELKNLVTKYDNLLEALQVEIKKLQNLQHTGATKDDMVLVQTQIQKYTTDVKLNANTAVQTVVQAVDNLKTNATTVAKTVNETGQTVAVLRANAEATKKALNEFNVNVQSTRNKMQEIENSQTNLVQNADKSITNLQQSVVNTNKQIESLKETTAHVKEAIQAIKTDGISIADQQKANQKSGQDALQKQKISNENLDKKLKELNRLQKEALDRTTQALDVIYTQAGVLQTNTQNISDKIEFLSNGISQQQENFESLRTQTQNLIHTQLPESLRQILVAFNNDFKNQSSHYQLLNEQLLFDVQNRQVTMQRLSKDLLSLQATITEKMKEKEELSKLQQSEINNLFNTRDDVQKQKQELALEKSEFSKYYNERLQFLATQGDKAFEQGTSHLKEAKNLQSDTLNIAKTLKLTVEWLKQFPSQQTMDSMVQKLFATWKQELAAELKTEKNKGHDYAMKVDELLGKKNEDIKELNNQVQNVKSQVHLISQDLQTTTDSHTTLKDLITKSLASVENLYKKLDQRSTQQFNQSDRELRQLVEQLRKQYQENQVQYEKTNVSAKQALGYIKESGSQKKRLFKEAEKANNTINFHPKQAQPEDGLNYDTDVSNAKTFGRGSLEETKLDMYLDSDSDSDKDFNNQDSQGTPSFLSSNMGIVVGVGVVLAIGAVILYKRRERSQSADSNGSNDSFTYK